MIHESNISFAELEKLISQLFESGSFSDAVEQFLAEISRSYGADAAVLCSLKKDFERGCFIFDKTGIISSTDTLSSLLDTYTSEIITSLGKTKSIRTVSNVSSVEADPIFQFMNCSEVCYIPCLFNNSVIGFIVLAKKTGSFGDAVEKSGAKLSSFSGIMLRTIEGVEHNRYLENKAAQKQKLETVGKITGGIAHDVSNILSSIFGSVALLKRKTTDRPELLRLITTIENSAIRAKDLTKNLLSHGKATSKLNEVVHPDILVEEVRQMIIDSFPDTLSLSVTLEEKPELIFGNSTQLFQVLLNLCINARDAMESRGELNISVSNLYLSAKEAASYSSLKSGTYVRITVRDSGSGISEENLGKIFDPFFSTKSETDNSGLGLYTVYGIVKAHQGHIEVKSKVGIGTRFDIYLPALSKSQAPVSPASPIILIADDEPELSDLLSELLESYNYYVVKVKSGTEAIRVISEEIKIDLVILDFNMPGMNGLDTLKRIREINYTVPVILSTGSSGFNNEIPLAGLNVNATIDKPYDFETMLATIRELL